MKDDVVTTSKTERIISRIKGASLDSLLEKGFLQKIKANFPNAHVYALGIDLDLSKPLAETVFSVTHGGRHELEKKLLRLNSRNDKTHSEIIKVIKEAIKE